MKKHLKQRFYYFWGVKKPFFFEKTRIVASATYKIQILIPAEATEATPIYVYLSKMSTEVETCSVKSFSRLIMRETEQ